MLSLPGIPLVPWALPAAMLLAFVAGELVLRRVAALSRLLITADPEVARRADEMMRAQMITALQAITLLTISAFATAQSDLLSDQVVPQSRPLTHPLFLLATAASLPPLVLWLSAALIFMARGRLGGAKTGWPWRPMMAQ